MKKIIYFLQDRYFFHGDKNVVGGHIAHIIGVIEAFQRIDYKVILCSSEKIPGWQNNAIEYHQISEKEGNFPKFNKLIHNWQISSNINRIIQDEMPEFLYTRWSNNIFFPRISKSHPSVPIVIECNTPAEMNLMDSVSSSFRKKYYHMIDSKLIYSATIISAVSNVVKDFLLHHHKRLDRRRVIVNPNGVDMKRFTSIENDIRSKYDIPHDAVVIGWAGNLRRWHRVDLLIQAFQELNLEDGYLMIIGTGPQEILNELSFLSKQGRTEQIIFTGPRNYSMMPAYLSACDILAAPGSASYGNRFHQSPIKLFEYMATGRAIIVSGIDQMKDVIKDGKNGLIFEVDSIDDLVRGLLILINNRELRFSLGRQARSDAKKIYSWENNVIRILDSLENVIA